jgi:hypothetical protein
VLTAKDLTAEDRERLSGGAARVMQKDSADALVRQLHAAVSAHRAHRTH